MEANSGGGPLSGVGVSHGNGAGAPTVTQLLHHGWQTQQPFFNEFSNQQPPENNLLFSGGGHGQSLHHQQLLQQQQQQMLQMAAAGNNHGQQATGQQGPHLGALPSMSMLLQGMQTQGIHQTLQSQPNSAQPGFLLLPNIGHPHQGQHGRDLSPNSTPSLSGHPPSSNTPPELSERNWASQAAQHSILFGHRIMNHHPDKLDEMPNHMALAAAMSAAANGQGGIGELFHPESFHGINQQGRQQQQQDQTMPINQIHMSDLAMSRGMNLYQHHYVSANSPPQMFNQQMPPQQMPPRPRPEGGQDPPSFINEHEGKRRASKKDDLIIGSWSEEDMEKLEAHQQMSQPQHGFGPSHILHQRSSEEKEPTGWGAPPPPNASNASGWGTVVQPPLVTLQNQGVIARKNNWNPGNMFEPPSPVSQEHLRGSRGGARPPSTDFRPRFNVVEPFDVVNGLSGVVNTAPAMRGAPRGRGVSGSRGRGGHHQRGDLTREKEDGKKSALAETVAMMSKMKMEDKERKEPIKFDKRRGGPDDTVLYQDGSVEETIGESQIGIRRAGFPDRDGVAGFYEMRSRGRGSGRGGAKFAKSAIATNNGPPPPTIQPSVKPPTTNQSSTDGIPPFPGVGKMSASQNTVSFPGSYPTQPPNPFIPVAPGFRFPRGPNGRGLPFGLNGPRGPMIPQIFANQSRQLLLPRPPFLHQRPPVRNMTRPIRGSSVASSARGVRHSSIGSSGFPVRGNEKTSFQDPAEELKGAPSQDENLAPPTITPNNCATSPLEEEDNTSCNSIPNAESFTEEAPKNLLSGQGNLEGQLALFASEMNEIEVSNLDLKSRLTYQLVKGTLCCLVCLDNIKRIDEIWNCYSCFAILHLDCVKKWVKVKTGGDGGKCPICRLPSLRRLKATCLCSKTRDPLDDSSPLPHHCQEICNLPLYNKQGCQHYCTSYCHPGPCPPCVKMFNNPCHCYKTTGLTSCNTYARCYNICEKVLECNKHICEVNCHEGKCPPCTIVVSKTCFCERSEPREFKCDELTAEEFASPNYSCKNICGNTLTCGNHQCKRECHPGDCYECETTENLNHCPCGKKTFKELGVSRTSCLDPLPTCDNICGKTLFCGPPKGRHFCLETCHVGLCPPCSRTTMVRCNCKESLLEKNCSDGIPTDYTCSKKCTKRNRCGRHKCHSVCCTKQVHDCEMPCNGYLDCGNHVCPMNCHIGKCLPCMEVIEEAVECTCGQTVLHPPVPCNKIPPKCPFPCDREHECQHVAMHTCHYNDICPPCMELVETWCFGLHEMRKHIPCHQGGFFCGRPCDKDLPCKKHQCKKPCHENQCLDGDRNEKCIQPCKERRPVCKHHCNLPCHSGACPTTECKAPVRITCSCGNLSKTTGCSQLQSKIAALQATLIASKMSELRHGLDAISAAEIMKPSLQMKNGENYPVAMECDSSCALIERNRRLAEALQVQNPDLTDYKGPPKYSDTLKDFARKDRPFAQFVHDKLKDLVLKMNEDNRQRHFFSFPVMKKDKRAFVHEYATFFGLQTESNDPEPHRNVSAVATKDKCYLPTLSIVEVVFNTKKAASLIEADPIKSIQAITSNHVIQMLDRLL